MKIKSVSGLTCYVKNLGKTLKFYETLGLEVRKKESNHATVYSNWFWIDLIVAGREGRAEYKKAAGLAKKGGGILVFLSVDDVDAFHKYLRSKGIKALSEPRDWPSGNREFMVRDPDGYNLVVFKRI
jgi:catechol 2,3-dioxygenase-like lactoylglutathione lyase family enzyme